MLEDFSTESFRSILIFPYLEVSKEKSWHVKLAIAEKVYFYRYPFYLPEEFLTYDDTYDLKAKIFFLLSFSTTELEKEFRIQEVLDQVNETVLENPETSKSLDKLQKQLKDGEFSGGRGAKKIKGTKTLFELRSGGPSRVYIRFSKNEKGAIEIIGESDKKRQQEVIKILKANYD